MEDELLKEAIIKKLAGKPPGIGTSLKRIFRRKKTPAQAVKTPGESEADRLRRLRGEMSGKGEGERLRKIQGELKRKGLPINPAGYITRASQG